MMVKEEYLRWFVRLECLGGMVVGAIAPAWGERWTAWGIVTTVSFAIVLVYGYSKLMPIEALVAGKLAAFLGWHQK